MTRQSDLQQRHRFRIRRTARLALRVLVILGLIAASLAPAVQAQ
jgi:hypothetical protein